ncbi:MAG: hypothetical protein AB1394_04295 [Bacteroidota bacterium]
MRLYIWSINYNYALKMIWHYNKTIGRRSKLAAENEIESLHPQQAFRMTRI